MMGPYDERQLRCPRLGHEITFSYCEREGGELPCPRIVRCWQPFLPIETYLKETLAPDVLERFSHQVPADKVSSLLELIERAKRTKGSGDAVPPDKKG